MNYGVDHIGQVSYVAEHSSDHAVQVNQVQVTGPGVETAPIWLEGEWGSVASKLEEVGKSNPLPDVVNLSLGGCPARFYVAGKAKFDEEFVKAHGERDTWDDATKDLYKKGIAEVAQQAVADFRRLDGAVGGRLRTAIDDLVSKGVTVTIAVGNEGGMFRELNELGVTIPEGFDSGLLFNKNSPPGVIVVGGSQDNSVQPGRNSGDFSTPNKAVDVAADATDIQTGHGTPYGTSLAAPQVASLVADMRAVNPDLTPAAIEKILVDSASPASPVRRVHWALGSSTGMRRSSWPPTGRLLRRSNRPQTHSHPPTPSSLQSWT